MATHSSVLAWRIPGTGEPGGLQTHVHRVGDAIQPSHPRSFPSPPGSKSGDFGDVRILIEHVLCSRHLRDTREDAVLVK